MFLNNNYNKENSIKITIVGTYNCGKSTWLEKQYGISENWLRQSIHFDRQEYVLSIWDTYGNDRYRSLWPYYIKMAEIVLILVDISKDIDYDYDVQTFLNIIEEVSVDLPNPKQIIFVGTKVDRKNIVSSQLMKEKANELHIPYFEISSEMNEYFYSLEEILLKSGCFFEVFWNKQLKNDFENEIVFDGFNNTNKSCFFL